MSDIGHEFEDEIIRSAYAERVRDAFRIFAEALSMGENEKACKDRFYRALLLTRKARDMAIDTMNGVDMIEPTAEITDTKKNRYAATRAEPDPLSAEDQAMIEEALSKTTGVSSKPLLRR